MSSMFVVPVAKVINLREHPNASLLGLADVLGYQMVLPLVEDPDGCIVRSFFKGVRDEKGKRVACTSSADGLASVEATNCQAVTAPTEEVRFRHAYSEGELVVYFPADTVLPAAWVDKFGVRALMKGPDQNRVGRIRLRGEPSFGLVAPIPKDVLWTEGDNVADFFGATKYEPPMRVSCGDAAPVDSLIDPYFLRFTDIQNGRIFTDVFTPGEEVIFTEKIHGTNCRVGLLGGRPVAGSMEVRRTRPMKELNGQAVECELDSPEIRSSTYWFPFSLKGVSSMLADLAEGTKNNVILYGEVYGGSIQSLTYGIPKGRGVGFLVFGLSVNGRYLDWDTLAALCQQHCVETVPVVYRGPFSMELAKQHADGNTVVAADGQIREGIVVYPLKERIDPKLGRAVLKFIGTEYELSKHKERDNKDV